MDEIKIYRLREDGTRIVIEVDLEDPDETPVSKLTIQNEDTVFIDYSSVLIWRDIFSILAGPLAIISAILVTVDRLAN